MTKISNRDIVLATAIELFNTQGVVNVRLQDISDASVISLGNITYHFRTKDDLILSIWKIIEQEQKLLMTEFRTMPLFEDIDRYLAALFALQQKYVFFYQDTLEVIRAFPVIEQVHRRHIEWQLQQIEFIFQFNISRGVFEQNDYRRVAYLWLWLSEGWLNRMRIMSSESPNFHMYRDDLWLILLGYMTEEGKAEYDALEFKYI